MKSPTLLKSPFSICLRMLGYRFVSGVGETVGQRVEP